MTGIRAASESTPDYPAAAKRPTLPTERRSQIGAELFQVPAFRARRYYCLALPEIIAEKIRACYQRSKGARYL